jgi:two-component system, NarL family, nitrate/nitrite response regulator NarL
MGSIFKRLLLRWLNRDGSRTGVCTLQLDTVLLDTLSDLAEQEQRPRDEVASELLSFAILQRNEAGYNLRRWRGLTPREQEVAALVALGYTNRQIAGRLHITPETVKTHTHNVMRKFDISRKENLRNALAVWDFSAWDSHANKAPPE